MKESEQRYRSLVEVSPEAIFVHRNGIIEYMNPMGAKMLGMDSVEDIIGKSVFQFVHLSPGKVYKKNRNHEGRSSGGWFTGTKVHSA
ncbi:PAS domain S-box protein [[Brevibacterium] frigoritolerans]|uniref:PAS domain S-box protein n=1 Tax=Peribacillus frigoritolerans TaxID=450367 RepID=A0A941J3R1_9BACI|nr:PAS domain S-box protein [Peribacillus frigoritolerans]